MSDKDLIGKTIKELKIADDKKALLFILEDGEVIARVDGDCCSDTWIEHVEIPTELPAKVISIDELELNADMDTRDGELAFYGHKISTDKGDIIIDYRNESNGYYGGNIVFGDDGYFYGGVYGQNVSSLNWVDISA